MTKKQFLGAVNNIDDEFINELFGAPDGISDISEAGREAFLSDEPEVVYLTNARVPFWKIAASAAAALCVFAAGVFAIAKLRAPQQTEPNAAASTESSAVMSSASEASLPEVEPLPKIKRVDDEGHDFNFRLYNSTTERHLSEPALKNDTENYAVFSVICRGVSEENPLRIWVMLVEDGETVKRVSCLEITEDGSHYYTVPYEYYELKKGEECVLQVIADDEAYIEGKWLP